MNAQKTKKPVKLSIADLKHRHGVLRDGLHDFLDDNNLHLSEQNFERAFQHLLSSTAHHEDLTLYDVTNYLQQILEHQEYVIETMNKTGLAEESLIKLIVTAEDKREEETKTVKNSNVMRPDVKNWKFSIKALPLPVVVSLVLLLGYAVAKPFMLSPFYP
ncbi:MAG: hypothetical protein MRY79_08905 [Alphaproteobacteria bacterium]|nr:hypothetical protein [Alphaproteobacteria bacterium]